MILFRKLKEQFYFAFPDYNADLFSVVSLILNTKYINKLQTETCKELEEFKVISELYELQTKRCP